jgi:hypothetical protein
MTFQHSFTPQRFNLMCLTSSRFGENGTKNILNIKCDKGEEYDSKSFNVFCKHNVFVNKQWLCTH